MPIPRSAYFPIGVVHHADFLKQSPPLDPDDYRDFMRGELENIRALGLTTYNLNLAWFDLEVAPGEFDWRRTDAIYELCQEFGLRIFAWIFAELTPRWLVKEHPETAAVAATGYSGPSHSYGSSLVRERIKQYIDAVVARYGGAAIEAYNVGVESGLFWTEAQDSGEPAARLWDYNPEVVARFGGWLERKYGTLHELNRIHRDHYRSFDEVEPPNSRFMREQFMLINQVPWLDWRLFMCDLVTEYIHFKAECVRAADPGATVAEQSYGMDPAMNGQDIWRTNSAMDAIGTSMFVSGGEDEHLLGSYWHDYFRSSGKGKPYWIWELRCGQNAWGLTNWGPSISAEVEGRLTWQAVAHEVKSVQYWNWRPHIGGIEVGGHGMTTRDGRLTPRALRVGAIARVLNADPAWYSSLRLPEAQVAVLDPQLSRIIATGEGSDAYVTSSQFGAYAALRALGLRVDFVHEDEVDRGELSRYRMLVLPFAYAMGRRTAERIRAWVEAGGVLVSGIWPAAKDEYGYGQEHNPGLGLHEVFGAEESELRPIRGDGDDGVLATGAHFGDAPTGRAGLTVTAAVPGSSGAAVGRSFAAFAYLSSLSPAVGTTVVATDETGAAVATYARFGEGAALLVGTFPVRDAPFASDGYTALLADLCEARGITPSAAVLAAGGVPVEAELLQSEGEDSLLVVMNAGDREATITVWAATRAVSGREVESGAAVGGRRVRSGAEFSLTIAGGDARAFRLAASAPGE